MTRAGVLASLVVTCAGARLAAADAHKLLVLKSEGNADAATRAKVDAEVLRLARTLTGVSVEAGEITFTDAAAAVGCSGSEAECSNDVLGTMGVDEVVAITVAAMPSGDTRILVDRIAKGTAVKAAQTTVPAGQPLEPKLDADVGPAFGVKAPAVAAASEPAPGNPAPTTAPEPPPTPTPPAPAPTTAAPAPVPPPFGEAAPAPMTAEPPPETPHSEASSNGPLIGMAAGGGLIVLSLIMWGEASATQSDINSAPTVTTSDFKNLTDLESKGDTYAALGNVFFLGGIATAAVSGYFFWRHHRAHPTSQAFVTPTVFAHGAGIALTFGGSP